MKKSAICIYITLMGFFITGQSAAQRSIRDEAVTFQQQRMVFRQWDSDKFSPKPGFLYLNPYYWMTWALHPNYPKNDLRPLGPLGTQTQRLGLALAMSQVDKNYELSSDTIASVALGQINGYSPLLAKADPLWLLYYKKQLSPVINFDRRTTLSALNPQQASQLLRDGSLQWYNSEMEMLRERLNGSENAWQERGARILSYHRLLEEFRKLNGSWRRRVKGALPAKNGMDLREGANAREIVSASWQPGFDLRIAAEVLKNRKY